MKKLAKIGITTTIILAPACALGVTLGVIASQTPNVNVSNIIVVKTQGEKNAAYQIADAVKYATKSECKIVSESENKERTIILDQTDSKIQQMLALLPDDYCAIEYDKSLSNNIYIAAKTGLARTYAVDHLLKNHMTPNGIDIPEGKLSWTQKVLAKNYITELYKQIDTTASKKISKYRDPFIFYDENTSSYFMVATATTTGSKFVGDDWWHLWQATGDFNDPTTTWEDKGYVIDESTSAEIKGDRWAPELYKYTNPDTHETNYYIFTTYGTVEPKSNEEDRGRGCAVFRSSSLLDNNDKAAKFELISYYDNPNQKGRITNHSQSCIDGHLYIENNTPYMVFVEEFTDFNPKNGRMFVAKMSNDLTHFVEPAKELFKATDAPWVSQEPIQDGQFRVTDGPFIYKLSSGKLLMLWSSYYDAASKQYCMGYATANSIFGPWSHGKRLIYEESMLEGYTSVVGKDFSLQGGHGMIFKDKKGRMYMCIHCGAWDKLEHPFIFPIKEQYDTLVWDMTIRK